MTASLRRLLAAAVLTIPSAALLACASGSDGSPDDDPTPTTKVTFARDIAPLLQEHCQTCHRPEGHAPFPLTTFEEAEPYARLMKAATAEQRMPQGPSIRLDTGCSDADTFEGQRRLTQEEIDLFARWADDGAVFGDPADLPPPRTFDDPTTWSAGEPDLVLTNAEGGFALPGGLGRDVFRRFALDPGLDRDVFITGFEALPGTGGGENLARVVHHVTLFIDPGRKSLEQQAAYQADPALPGAGFEGDFDYPVELVGMWFPGSAPIVLPAGQGIRVPAGSCIVMEVHYGQGGPGGVVDTTLAGLTLADAVETELKTSLVKNTEFVIPAGSTDTVIEATRSFDAPFTLYSITPHMHQLGTDIEVTLELPGDGPMCLADVDWDFEHQGTYRLRQPLELPAGTVIHTTCRYDNSAANPNQFNDPPADIVFGAAADKEMCQLTIATSAAAAPPPPASGALMINELLADPPVGFDANGDGTADPTADEFVELVNVGGAPLDLSGAVLSDLVGPRATLPAGTTLAPGAVLVVFGGGSPAAIPGAQVVTAGALRLNNDGDTLTIRGADGAVLASLSYGVEGGHDESLVRAQEKDPGAAMIGHTSVSAQPASPGRRASGGAL